jgi:predicted DCC family thiol-disulfide oxidoreductase YuxK
VQGPLIALRARLRAIAQACDTFFFSPADPSALGLIRLGTGLILLWSLVVTGMDLQATLGSHGWVDPELARQRMGDFGWSFWLWVPDRFLTLAWAVAVLVTAMFAVGWGSRLTAVLAWAIAVSTTRRSPAILFGFDSIITTWAFYLAVTGASGQAVSLDRFLRRYRQARAETAHRRIDGAWTIPTGVPTPTISANLGLRLIQIHLAFIYGLAGLSKLQAAAWWDGSAVGKLLGNAEFRPFNLTGLLGSPGAETFLNLATHGTVLLEIGYPVFIWLRAWRPWVIVAAVIFHAAIGLTLGLYEFALAMTVGNVAFISGYWLRERVTGRAQPSGKVLYDGACPRCRASMAFLVSADPDHLIDPVDLTAVDVASIHPTLTKEACMRSMHVVRAEGRVVAGYDAVMTLARWLPLTWIPSLVGWIPGMAWVGRRIYNQLASTRPRDEPCTDEACGIHPPASRGTTAGAGSESGRATR